ncbi:DUF943 family protein [Vibrio quintilis]|uniref:Uncharacterized protein n=1 Tax=Vibrio quintilis TaxID=1117707 RepID=A0A1M7Z002_9VIBR|nr:DUF943 family protein [Vibrio quintilis]SHO58238.1 hypothetical protein VQ7734_04008 [Vibrio quintilis]
MIVNVTIRKSCIKLTLGSLLVLALLYLIYAWLKPVQIINVYQNKYITDVVVKNFPVTTRGKISWWKENKESLKAEYNFPNPLSDGTFYIYVWDIGKGIQEISQYDQEPEQICFKQRKIKNKCIEKNILFEISKTRNGGLQYR